MRLTKKIVNTSILLGILLWIVGCAGTGFERKTSLMPDEFSLSSKINPEENNWTPGPEWTIGFKWRFE